VFLPFLLYSITFIWYVSKTFDTEFDHKVFGFTYECLFRHVIIFSIVYFASIELAQLLRDRAKYFKQPLNLTDWASLVLNTFVILSYVNKVEYISLHQLRVVAAVAVFLLWAKIVYLLRLFSQLSFYIRLIKETLYDIRYRRILDLLQE